MTNPQIEVMYTQWRKAHRQVLEVPYMTHCDLLPLINDNMPLDCLLDCKYITFLKSILNSEINIVNFTAKYKLFDQTSTLGKNITHLVHKYNIPVEDLTLLPKQRVKYIFYNKWITGVNIQYPMYASIIKDMVMMREGKCTRVLSNDACKCIIDFCCTI